MINEYIEKNKLMSHLFNKQDEDIDVMFEIANFNAEDVVSVSTYNQVRWERDIAMQQLEDHGIPFCCDINSYDAVYSFGKIDLVLRRVDGEDKRTEITVEEKRYDDCRKQRPKDRVTR